MSGDTIERPPQPKPGSPGGITHHNPCGDVIIWPWPMQLDRGTSIHNRPDGGKETWIRYAVDNLVAFIPPRGSRCKEYDFMQFVMRTATNTKTGNAVPRYAHPWRPDINGWEQRQPPTFLDPMELIYDPNLVSIDRAHHALIRRDGPGYDFPPGQPPKDLTLHWSFKLYIICKDATDALKVVALIEFGFEIAIDGQGVPTLNLPAAVGDDGYPNLTSICCNTNDAFDEWIDQWHAHTVVPNRPLKSLRKLYSTMPKLIDESVRSRRVLHYIENTGPAVGARSGREQTRPSGSGDATGRARRPRRGGGCC